MSNKLEINAKTKSCNYDGTFAIKGNAFKVYKDVCRLSKETMIYIIEQVSGNPEITTLNLGFPQIDNDAFDVLCNFIYASTQLLDFRFYDHRITLQQCEALSHAIRHSSSIKCFHNNFSHIGNEGIFHIALFAK